MAAGRTVATRRVGLVSLALAMPLAMTAGPAVAGPTALTGSVPVVQQAVLAAAPPVDATATAPDGLAVAPATGSWG
jgi:hypothetical protein